MNLRREEVSMTVKILVLVWVLLLAATSLFGQATLLPEKTDAYGFGVGVAREDPATLINPYFGITLKSRLDVTFGYGFVRANGNSTHNLVQGAELVVIRGGERAQPVFAVVGEAFTVRLSETIGPQGGSGADRVFAPYVRGGITEPLGGRWRVQVSAGVSYAMPSGDDRLDNELQGVVSADFCRDLNRGGLVVIAPSVSFGEESTSVGITVGWVFLKDAR